VENSHSDYTTIRKGTQGVDFKIDPEFENKIPPIGAEEFRQLEENILTAREVYEPLVVWDGTLVDGHNRWKVLQRHSDITIKWRVRHMDFPDKWAAFEWMYKNQLGRRNLTDEQRTYMIGKMYEARKKSVGEHKGNQHSKLECAQNEHIPKLRTVDKIAHEIGVGKETVKRPETFSKGVDALREVSPEAADKVLEGKSKITKTEVADLAKSEPDIIEAFAQAVNEGKRPERKPRKPKTEEEKRDMAEIEAIMADMRDPTTTPEFTIDYLIEDIEINGQTYVELLANTLKDRSNLVTDENKPRIAAAIDKVVESIMKVREQM
jgi:hypothetical protein